MSCFIKKICVMFLVVAFVYFPGCEKENPTSKRGKPTGKVILLSGTVDITPEMKQKADPLSILFIIARGPQGRVRAVRKMFPPFEYPLSYQITEKDLMIPGVGLPSKLSVQARLDQDGDANPTRAGDILGKTSKPWVKPGDHGVNITLQELIK